MDFWSIIDRHRHWSRRTNLWRERERGVERRKCRSAASRTQFVSVTSTVYVFLDVHKLILERYTEPGKSWGGRTDHTTPVRRISKKSRKKCILIYSIFTQKYRFQTDPKMTQHFLFLRYVLKVKFLCKGWMLKKKLESSKTLLPHTSFIPVLRYSEPT